MKMKERKKEYSDRIRIVKLPRAYHCGPVLLYMHSSKTGDVIEWLEKKKKKN